jgi:hypothetical protein
VTPSDKDIPITRAVGRFLGHLWSAATSPAQGDEPEVHEVKRETEEHQGEIQGRKVTLRRTTIEEVEFNDPAPPAPPAPPDPDQPADR